MGYGSTHEPTWCKRFPEPSSRSGGLIRSRTSKYKHRGLCSLCFYRYWHMQLWISSKGCQADLSIWRSYLRAGKDSKRMCRGGWPSLDRKVQRTCLYRSLALIRYENVRSGWWRQKVPVDMVRNAWFPAASPPHLQSYPAIRHVHQNTVRFPANLLLRWLPPILLDSSFFTTVL